jgi:formylglycine-generating enzyme required for sulfatase activity
VARDNPAVTSLQTHVQEAVGREAELKKQIAMIQASREETQRRLDTLQAQVADKRTTITNSIGIKLKLIPTGTGQMGSEDGEEDEKPVHKVRITKPFYLGVTEVTNAQWQVVMGGEPPSRWKDADRPVERVSWNDAVQFCKKLSARPEEREAGRAYRLPTEAEWEYACRAGTTTKWASGDDEMALREFAWFTTNSGAQTYFVGQKQPNAWGLDDMHGNVWEWCSDSYGPYAAEAVANPTGPASGSDRVSRGGSWLNTARRCGSANRSRDAPAGRYDSLGFRLAMSPFVDTPSTAANQVTDDPESSEAKQVNDAPSTAAPQPTPLAAKPSEILARPPIMNSIGMSLKLIPAGTFMMGSEDGEADEKPAHEVRITKPFYLGVTEVTNAQWQVVMGSEPPSRWKEADRPVEQVTWTDAVEFCKKLSERPYERAAARVYRLPTEAEWEYACRAGTTTKWASGDGVMALSEFAWFTTNSNGQAQAVGQKQPNAWDLHDMHGNVWEWCSDWGGAYGANAVADPTGLARGLNRVFRGGGWLNTPRNCRSAYRNGTVPSFRIHGLGFRLALSPSGSMPPEAEK